VEQQRLISRFLKKPLLGYLRLRSSLYTVESLLGPAIELVVNQRKPVLPTDRPELFREARSALLELFQRDVENIINGVYPIEVLTPESPLRHLRRIPKMFFEGIRISRRRSQRNAKDFTEPYRELLQELPDYYRRNFHYQGNGYLSDDSAELYDHQVEVLFAGAADAMRRLMIKPMREHFLDSRGEGLRFLELGSGTGSATEFVRLVFPKAHIVSVDLSAAYLRQAQRRLNAYARHDFVEANAESLPFKDAHFDAVYSVFLFHELPRTARQRVIQESFRLLKPGGFFALVDSLQMHDVPALNEALQQFPMDFHEPFYRDYITHPIEDMVLEPGLQQLHRNFGFFSKVVSARKA